MSSASYEYGPAADRARKLLALRRRRRWPLWFGVAVILIVPAIAAYVVWTKYRGAEAKAAALAQQLGGKVTWNDGRLSGGSSRRHVMALSFAGSHFNDAQLSRFTPWWWHLPQLSDLDLSGTAITDDGLKHLSGCPIKHLSLSGTKITNYGLRHLVECPALASLSLSKTAIDDAGLENVCALSNLRSLYLDGTAIGDAGLQRLETLASLQYLRLGNNPGVTYEGIARLEAALPELKITRGP